MEAHRSDTSAMYWTGEIKCEEGRMTEFKMIDAARTVGDRREGGMIDVQVKDRIGQMRDSNMRDGAMEDEDTRAGGMTDGGVRYEELGNIENKVEEIKDVMLGDGKMRDLDIQDKEMKDGDMKNEDMRDGEMKDGEMKDGEMRNGVIRDGEMSYEEIGDGEMRDGEITVDFSRVSKSKPLSYPVISCSLKHLSRPWQCPHIFALGGENRIDFEVKVAPKINPELGRIAWNHKEKKEKYLRFVFIFLMQK